MPDQQTDKMVYVVLEITGGWSGTEPDYNVYRAFTTREAAEAYVAEQYAADRRGGRSLRLWSGAVFQAEVIS